MDIRGKFVSIVGTVLSVAAIVTAWVMGDSHGVKKVHKQRITLEDCYRQRDILSADMARHREAVQTVENSRDNDQKAIIAQYGEKFDFDGTMKNIEAQIANINEAFKKVEEKIKKNNAALQNQNM